MPPINQKIQVTTKSLSREDSFGDLTSSLDTAPPNTANNDAKQKRGLFKDSAEKPDFDQPYHDVIKITPELSGALSNILQAYDGLDSSAFNCIDYVNHIFPTEQSLATSNVVVEKLKRQIQLLDRQIRDLVVNQAASTQQANEEMEIIKRAIKVTIGLGMYCNTFAHHVFFWFKCQELVTRIKTIKLKASESEQMVLEITQDIKSLDYTKQNLTQTIHSLKHLQAFVTALDLLKGVANRKQYRETAHLLQVVLLLFNHFEDFKEVKQVAALLDTVEHLQLEVKKTIFNEFESRYFLPYFVHLSVLTVPYFMFYFIAVLQMAPLNYRLNSSTMPVS